ncbi:MAG: hypothetical protein A2474_05370 [Elusimicrobia bacterium RIFOXYC2_FULL_34_12]|nr:MAG: hypothetical protein A2474_05370 [Elusimicrobia bacterium RIFOXYC2_FULL_34_12]OGS38466.1 MAG: hypothetical protein A2551_07640 [Elusimicrobia bacterium RIFOXYD2_FULL_34_30]HAM38681.1 hypothetical protein [Elusimicrobiota bacterium]
MKKNYFIIIFSLFILSGFSFLNKSKKEYCKITYHDKTKVNIESIGIVPVIIGFATINNPVTYVPILRSPFTIVDSPKKYHNYKYEKLVIDRESAEKISEITSEHFYTILSKEKRFSRIVQPKSIKNIIRDEKVDLSNFKQMSELNNSNVLGKLSEIADELQVDGLLISIIKKCETEIVFQNLISMGRENFGEPQKSMSYSYIFELETGIFSNSLKKIIWIGESKELKSNRTPSQDQNLIIAVINNKLEKFFKKLVLEKVLNDEPEYKCVLKIVNSLSF